RSRRTLARRTAERHRPPAVRARRVPCPPGRWRRRPRRLGRDRRASRLRSFGPRRGAIWQACRIASRAYVRHVEPTESGGGSTAMSELTSTRLRLVALIAGVIAAVAGFLLYNPWFNPDGDAKNSTTWAFWIGFIVLIVALFFDRKDAPESDRVEIEGPAFTRFLFGNTRAGLVWLPIRLFLGFEWLDAGLHKLTGTGWIDGGSALLAYWQRAVTVPDKGAPPITFEWYRSFLQFLIDNNLQGLFGWLIPLGETAVGLGLLFGALTGIAAFFGAMLNMSFLLAGSTSVNPVMFTLAIGLILAWRVAGYYGLDPWLLPALGAPWSPGALFNRKGTASASSPPPARGTAATGT